MANSYFPQISTNRKQDAQTIHAPFQAYVGLKGVAFVAAATTLDITAALTTALKTAARNSQEVPLQPSTHDEERGVITRTNLNRVLVYGAGTRKIEVNGQEVFGRITNAAAVYTISFFSIDATGAEVATTVPVQGAAGLSFEVPYLFNFHEIPAGALIAVTTRNVKEDIDAIARPQISRELTIATLNTVPDLPSAPNTAASIFFDYRGFHFSTGLTNSVMTVSAAGAVTYAAATAGIDLNVGEVLTVYYTPAA